MATELSIYDKFEHPSQLAEFGKAIMHSEMFGAKNASQGMVLAMECAARQIPPMTLAQKYDIIHGRLSMKATAMLAGFHELGGKHRVIKRDSDQAEIELTIDGETHVFGLTWAEALGEPFVYVGKESDVAAKLYKGATDKLTIKTKYQTPRSRMQMLWARVVSDGVRTVRPEIVSGCYTPEEIGDFDGNGDGGDVEVEKVAATKSAPSESVTEPEPEPTKLGVRLDGHDDPYAVNDSDPCDEETAGQIKTLAQKLEMPLEKLREIMARHGANKLVELPHGPAMKLLEKLRQKASDNDIPF